MKVIAIIEIDGDFKDELSNEEVTDIVKQVIDNGVELYCLSGSAEILEIIERWQKINSMAILKYRKE